jgi:hypothetical protein
MAKSESSELVERGLPVILEVDDRCRDRRRFADLEKLGPGCRHHELMALAQRGAQAILTRSF